MPIKDKYGVSWPDGTDELQIQFWYIRKGPEFIESKGRTLAHHYEECRKLMWPHLDDQRWHRLCLNEIRRKNAKVTVLMGPGSSGKTHEASWNYLTEYYVFPNETCVLVSSTDLRGLELRVWGEIKDLHKQALDRYPELPGNLIDSKHCIATDELDEDGEATIRDLRRGIIGIPTVQGGKTVGLGKWVGIKQKRMRLVADEASHMSSSFLSAFSNLDKNEDFQAIVLGNPVDVLDPLGRAAEPRDGWSAHMNPGKTEVWDTRFMNGRCVNLIGTDSPNMDFDETKPARYKYLISREKIANTAAFFGKDSQEFYSQCVGSLQVGQLARRVLTRDLCEKFGAFENVIWDGAHERRSIVGLDAAYSGDRCVITELEWGKSVDGINTLKINAPVLVPISVKSPLIPEDQISEFCKTYCEQRNIPPENFFHDSTGRGSLGTSLARVWSNKCNPVEFGGNPTERPVSLDLFVEDEDTGQKRLKRCNEHYQKFVSELWFAARYAIEARQLKNLNEETMEEGCMREWNRVKNDKIEVESKKDMRERVGRSPDLFDSLVIAIEGARRLGFQISKLAAPNRKKPGANWLDKERSEYEAMHEGKQLKQ